MPTKGEGGTRPKTLADTKIGRKTQQEQQEVSTIKKELEIQAGEDGDSTLRTSIRSEKAKNIKENTASSQRETITSNIKEVESETGNVEQQKQPKLREELQTERIRSSLSTSPQRQVIAVSASKGPAAFFNLARKFLVTDKMCDLSALEGAIVSAVDAAHLLERSKLATIVRIQTSYVAVGPKRKKNVHSSTAMPPRLVAKSTMTMEHGENWSFDPQVGESNIGEASAYEKTGYSSERGPLLTQSMIESKVAGAGVGRTKKAGPGPGGGKELRRARMIITVKRTDEYEKWLIDNPLQDEIAIVESEKRVVADLNTDESSTSKISKRG